MEGWGGRGGVFIRDGGKDCLFYGACLTLVVAF